MSFPAWSNFLTGLRPGRHGLFDFTLEALTQLRTTNVQPGVWGNLRGREPAGGVAPEDNERVRDEIIAVRRYWTVPDDGGPVVARVRRREETTRAPVAIAPPT